MEEIKEITSEDLIKVYDNYMNSKEGKKSALRLRRAYHSYLELSKDLVKLKKSK